MTIYIIDDHPLVRHAVAMTIQRIRANVKIVELDRFSEIQAAIIKGGEPVLFVLDLLLPGVKDTSAIKELRAMYPEVPIAVMSSMPANEAETSCIEAGADAYLEKTSTSTRIIQVVHSLFTAVEGESDAAPVTAEIKLSKRQKQLIILLDQGLSNVAIADQLDISEHTVKVHLWRLFRRIGVNSRTQTLHFARTNGLL